MAHAKSMGSLVGIVAFSLATHQLFAVGPLTVPPTATPDGSLPLKLVQEVTVPGVDQATERVEDERRAAAGLAPRFAIPNRVLITPTTHGTWETVDDRTSMWRLRVRSTGALSLNLGFTRYKMVDEGRLYVYSADLALAIRPFTADDNETHGELWTPVILADDIVVEVTLPTVARDDLGLELTSIGVGYRGFGEIRTERSGSCNVDVVCPEGDDWQDEIAAIAVIGTSGSTYCTGFMVNNTAGDATPYFMTANHCGISSGNAASLFVVWNYQNSWCRPPGGGASGGSGDGTLSDFQTGSYFRASYGASDMTLVELDDDPDPDWNVGFAGWDRSGVDATSAIAIHHPNTDEKRISFEYDPTTVTSYLGNSVPGDGTHVRVTDWDLGTTEPGSSGSPLFDQDHRIIGQLHGGYASCSSQTSDWYGRFNRSWSGGGSSSSRLSNWLDSAGTGATTVDTLVPGASGLRITPSNGLTSSGPAGGPIEPRNVIYTLDNRNDTAVDYTVTHTESWVTVTNPSGTLAAHATVEVNVYLNPGVDALPNGNYTDVVVFTNETDHDGDTTRRIDVTIGVPELVYEWALDTNPGWTAQPLWAFGQPTGGGGQYGNSDPTSGHTGPNVYGYNLSGDYQNNLAEKHLTTTAIDCSELFGVVLKFWRWLGVETPSYDHAYVRVSNNGTTWTTVWENAGEIADGSWNQQEIDISAVADGQSTLYVRWTMGTTDTSWQYCGWNIDDVSIWGVGAQDDCNNNGVPDDEDIASGTSDDCNLNGVPDECEEDPSITAQPADEAACIGGSATFLVTAAGYGAILYQWRKDGVDISGATQASYTVDPVSGGDIGDYDVTVTGDCGVVVSDVASLSIAPAPSAAQPDPSCIDSGNGTKGRYLSFEAGDTGRQQAIQITIASLPEYEYAEGRTMWVQTPQEVSESSGSAGPTPAPTHLAAELGCTPFYTDWSALGVVDVYDDAIIPGGAFEVRVIDQLCDTSIPDGFSVPLGVVMSALGDVVGDCTDCPCSSPDGTVDFVDISAVVEKFQNLPCIPGGAGVPRKARADLVSASGSPSPDRVADFVDIGYVVDAFRNVAPPLPGPPMTDPCE